MPGEDLKPADETSPEASEQPDDDGADSHYVDLPDASSLTEVGAAKVVRRSGGEIIVFAGLQGAGKTTLLASAYQKFLDGPFAGCSFQGSQCLRAFEERCYLARVASRGQVPATARTEQSEGLQILHLALRADQRESETINLLFADMAGEFFRRARDSAEECRKLWILRRANHLVLLVDGQCLVNPEQLHVCLRDARLLLRRFVECKMIGEWTSVQVVASKWDLISTSNDVEKIKEEVSSVKQQLHEGLGPELGGLSFAYVAASPAAKPELQVGYGVERLFQLWTARPAWELSPTPSTVGLADGVQREADRFRLSSVLGNDK